MPVDMRTRRLARKVVRYSTKVKPGEKVIISGGEESRDFLVELYKDVMIRGGYPIVRFSLPGIKDFFFKYANKQQLERFPQEVMDMVKKAHKYIGVYTEENTRELSEVDSRKITER